VGYLHLYASGLNEIASPCSLCEYTDGVYVCHFYWQYMHCNRRKPEFMLFRDEQLNIELSGVSIAPKEQMKVLGTILEYKLD